MSTAIKSIVYRGGIVAFKIPVTWREEYEPDGGATFYEDGADSGTLRLNVLSFERKSGGARNSADDFPEILKSGARLRHYRKEAEERGTLIYLYCWEILVEVPPDRCRLVCFSHTVLASSVESAATQEELRIVDSLVRDAEYSTLAGQKAAPWWKFWR